MMAVAVKDILKQIGLRNDFEINAKAQYTPRDSRWRRAVCIEFVTSSRWQPTDLVEKLKTEYVE